MSEQRWRSEYAERRLRVPGPHRHRVKQKKRRKGKQWWAIVAVEGAQRSGRTPVSHEFRYDSDLMMIDGQLTHRCHGCGEWETDDHPPPPLCVFSIHDFIDMTPEWSENW